MTAAQLRAVVGRLVEARHWRPGDPQVWVVMDAGYDAARLAWLVWPPEYQTVTRGNFVYRAGHDR